MSEQVGAAEETGTGGERREGCGDVPTTISTTIGSGDVPKWSDTQIAFARHRHEWLLRGDIPALDFDLTGGEWWDVIMAYNQGDLFGGNVPGDGAPRYLSNWTREQIDARFNELRAMTPPWGS